MSFCGTISATLRTVGGNGLGLLAGWGLRRLRCVSVVGQAMVAGVVPAKVAALMEGVMMSMMLTKLSKVVVTGLVVLCLCGLGMGGFQASPAQETKTTITTTTTTTITKKSKTDPRLEGTWKPIWSEADGKLFPPNEDTSTFADGIFMQKKGVWVVAEAIYKTVIDPKGERNDIDLTFITGINRGKTLYYSYRIDGDELHWVAPNANNVRPVSFSANAGYVVMQRVSPQATITTTTTTTSITTKTEKSATAKECMKQLQGTWTAIAPIGACGGRKTITFSGNRYKVVEGDDSVHTGTIQFVNLTGDPKSFDWDDDKGHWTYGIFQIDGDTLYFVGHHDPKARPTDFTSRPGDGRYGYVCKRVKPQEAAEEEQEEATARKKTKVKDGLLPSDAVWMMTNAWGSKNMVRLKCVNNRIMGFAADEDEPLENARYQITGNVLPGTTPVISFRIDHFTMKDRCSGFCAGNLVEKRRIVGTLYNTGVDNRAIAFEMTLQEKK